LAYGEAQEVTDLVQDKPLGAGKSPWGQPEQWRVVLWVPGLQILC